MQTQHLKRGMDQRPQTQLSLTQEEQKILLHYFPNGICAFDLEMTGLSPIFDRIIEIAGIKLTANGLIETFHSLVNPLIPIPEHTIKYHGLQNEDLRDAPTLKQPLRDFLDFIGNIPLVAHNGMFDASFLIMGMNQFNYQAGLSDIYDSCKFARSIFKHKKMDRDLKPDNFKLDTLAKHYQMDFTHHEAVDDAYISLKIFARCLIEYQGSDPLLPLKEHSFLFKLNAFKGQGEYILPSKLKEIKELVQTQTLFEIKYKGGTKSKDEFRKIRPLSILALPQGLVLYAECQITHTNKYFKIKKIQSIKVS